MLKQSHTLFDFKSAQDSDTYVLPSQDVLQQARSKLVDTLPEDGLGLERTSQHLSEVIVPGLSASSRSPNYYGFVTGGATPAAVLADNIVTAYDQNVQVHLPNDTIATDVEDRALKLLCDLLNFDAAVWTHRTFTTGATASNVIGLACGREYVICKAAERNKSLADVSVGELGLLEAMRRADIREIQVLTTVPHSSLGKAASLIGLGRSSVKLIGRKDAPHKFEMAHLEQCLREEGTASIVAISCSEVNTGRFATSGFEEMKALRDLCDRYGAWIHVDGAFGILGRMLDKPEFGDIIRSCEGMELADSITGDGHKLLNVPYDCGFLLSRQLAIATQVFQNANAAYLSSDNVAVPSPLNIGIENSRRFRALPVYATLTAYGRSGYREMLERQVRLSRGIAAFLLDNPDYELLPESTIPEAQVLASIFIIVIFRAKDVEFNQQLVSRINATRRIYVSGTSWDGLPACRFAVSNWKVDEERDLELIKGVLQSVVHEWSVKSM